MANNDGKADGDTQEKLPMSELEKNLAENDQPNRHLLEREDSHYHKNHRPNMDVNLYATKKSVAQGMMDIALLTANASQLKYVLREGVEHRFYIVNVICLGISIILQMLVGVLLILNTRYNINLVTHQARAENMNNFTIIGVFLITVANVFLSAFGTSP